MAQEDKWVDWQGIDPELSYPTFKAHFDTVWFMAPSSQYTHIYRIALEDVYWGALADWNAMNDHAAIHHLITGLYYMHDYFSTLVAACGTNKWNQTWEELSADTVMEKWLEKASELIP